MMNDLTFVYAEELFGQEYVIATYYLETTPDVDMVARAASFAVGQSVGTWTPVPGITREMLARHSARIVALYDAPPVEMAFDLPQRRAFFVQIAFPEANFGPQFPMMFTTLLGNDVSTAAQLKLVDLTLSRTFVEGFGGPKFGIADIGLDVMLGVGGAIQGHPDGAAAGGRALQQAIAAAVEGMPVAEKAQEHPELQKALERWGGE